MRLWLLIIALLGICSRIRGQSATQLIAELPKCALNCIFEALPQSPCLATDVPCICANADLWKNVTACIQPACTIKEALTAQKIAAKACDRPVRDKHREVQIVSPILAAIAFLLVAIRLVARKPSMSEIFGWDDTFIVFAWLTGFPLAIVQYYLGKAGLGRDIWTLSYSNITEVLRLFFVAEVFYLTSTVLTKMSILFFYLRVFTNQTFRTIVWAVLTITAAFYISLLFALIFQCSPVSYTWTRWDGEHKGRCINVGAGIVSHAALNMALDLVVLLLPIPLLFRLQLTYSFTARIHIFVMFSFGLVVTIISAIRLQTLVAFFNSKNPTYDFFGAALWSALETFIGIICACLPAAKVFFFRIAPKWFGLSTIGSSPGQQAQAIHRGSKSFAMSSKASSTNRVSNVHKPLPKLPSMISPIPEESDFLPLQGRDSESQYASTYRGSLPIQGVSEKEAESTITALPLQGRTSETTNQSRRGSWVVTGQHGMPLQRFGTVTRLNDKWPLT